MRFIAHSVPANSRARCTVGTAVVVAAAFFMGIGVQHACGDEPPDIKFDLTIKEVVAAPSSQPAPKPARHALPIDLTFQVTGKVTNDGQQEVVLLMPKQFGIESISAAPHSNVEISTTSSCYDRERFLGQWALVSGGLDNINIPMVVMLGKGKQQARYMLILGLDKDAGKAKVLKANLLSYDALRAAEPPLVKKPGPNATLEELDQYRGFVFKKTYWIALLGWCQDDRALDVLHGIYRNNYEAKGVLSSNMDRVTLSQTAQEAVYRLTGVMYDIRCTTRTSANGKPTELFDTVDQVLGRWQKEFADRKILLGRFGFSRSDGQWKITRKASFAPVQILGNDNSLPLKIAGFKLDAGLIKGVEPPLIVYTLALKFEKQPAAARLYYGDLAVIVEGLEPISGLYGICQDKRDLVAQRCLAIDPEAGVAVVQIMSNTLFLSGEREFGATLAICNPSAAPDDKGQVVKVSGGLWGKDLTSLRCTSSPAAFKSLASARLTYP